MIRVFLVLILLIASFLGGLYFERYHADETGKMNQQLSAIQSENQAITIKNQKLQQTLKLVKRQIQTDRIAYQLLQEKVESSESERKELKKKLENQKVLLEKLKAKLE